MSRAVVVVSFEEYDATRVVEIMDEVRQVLSDIPDLKIYSAIRESAEAVLDIFKDVHS